MGIVIQVFRMKSSPLTLFFALIIPIILVSAGSRPKKYRGEPPITANEFPGIYRCPQDVYSIWIFEIENDPRRVDFELKVGSLSSYGSFQQTSSGGWKTENQIMSAHWDRYQLETMSWLVKKYKDVVFIEREKLDKKGRNEDCRKLIVTFKDGSSSELVFLGPIPDDEKVKTTTTTTTVRTTSSKGPTVYPPIRRRFD